MQVVLVWQGISSLHKSFFSNSQATTALSLGLAGTVQGPANIYVRYDSVEFLGTIRLQLRPGTLRLVVRHDGDLIRLSDLAPVTRALAAYRSAVASHYDIRVESFRVGIESFRGPTSCIFGVAGTPPPDGSLLSPCVQVDGVEHCGRPEVGGIRFEPAVARAVRRCLDL
ncbi:MAG: hypothetical protein GXP62_10045 [Oligoflexia bacterium]|nr:hypothetical protein [Oligoflexia bacterium]